MPPRVLFRSGDWKDRIHIQRVSYAIDDGGGNIAIAATIAKDVPCVVVTSGRHETSTFTRQGEEESYTVTLPSDPKVRNGDRFLFRGRLLIVNSTKDEFDLGIVWTVSCLETVA